MRDDDNWGGCAGVLVMVVILFVGVVLAKQFAYAAGHKQGVIDATTGAWKAEQHAGTGEWIFWEVKE